MSDIVSFSGNNATIQHEGFAYTLDMTTLGHPTIVGGPDALTWMSPMLTSTNGGPPIRVFWPIQGNGDAQRLAVRALVALGIAANLPAAATLVTTALTGHVPPYAVRLDLSNL